MNPERYSRVKEIFLRALAHREEAQRQFLDQACAGDREVRQEVESLLQYHAVPPEGSAPRAGPSKGRQNSNE